MACWEGTKEERDIIRVLWKGKVQDSPIIVSKEGVPGVRDYGSFSGAVGGKTICSGFVQKRRKVGEDST